MSNNFQRGDVLPIQFQPIGQGNVTLNENATQGFTAAAFDQFGAPMVAALTFTWSQTSGIGSLDGAGNYTAPYATGTATIKVASGGVNNTANII